jgi:ABC-type bacteriocin/lantibiotic exporter with double-glycine peptidase domain
MPSISLDKSNEMKDNAIIVTQKLIERLKVKVTGASVKEHLLDHPDYPRLFSISDTLRDWHLDNAAVEITPAQLKEIDQPFLAHMETDGGFFLVVDKVNADTIEYYHSSEGQVKEPMEAFLEKFTGVVLIPFPEERSEEDA